MTTHIDMLNCLGVTWVVCEPVRAAEEMSKGVCEFIGVCTNVWGYAMDREVI